MYTFHDWYQFYALTVVFIQEVGSAGLSLKSNILSQWEM